MVISSPPFPDGQSLKRNGWMGPEDIILPIMLNPCSDPVRLSLPVEKFCFNGHSAGQDMVEPLRVIITISSFRKSL
jgi:hypothetical protein